MIEWGNTPVGSTAYIYWPQVAVSDVLALAKQLYSTHQLSAADANTVQVTVPRGFTFVPIPPGTGQNFAGLFTVDLPAGVKAGQVYSIVVRRVSSRRGPTTPVQQPPPAQPKIAVAGAVVEPGRTSHNWRYIVGTFAVQIPVTTAKVMLGPEENTLAIMKWRLEQTSPWNRWYPVLQRYIGYVVGRVNGLGGNAGTIVPSPWGVVPVPSQPSSLGQECTGKIAGLIYDHFGEFEAFLLETADCEVRRFCSREKKIELVVREAWRERSVVTVVIRGKEPCCLISIILGGIHPPCRCD
jgi:hypothetical protein